MAEEEEYDGFGDGADDGTPKTVPNTTAKIGINSRASSKIATLGRGIKLPGMGAMMGGGGKMPTVNGRPLSMAVPSGLEDQLHLLDGRGGGAGDVEHDDAPQKEEEELERMANPQVTGDAAAEKMAKMMRMAQMSRGIMVGPGLGLAGVMGGKKAVPKVDLEAPYSEHKPGSAVAAKYGTSSPKPTRSATGPNAPRGFRLPMPGDAGPKKAGGAGGAAGEAKKGGIGGLAAAIANTSAGKASADASASGGGSGRSTPKAPGSPRVGGRSEIRCVGAGSGGVEEMRAKLNEGTVQWGLLRFSIGSGTFQRNKMLLIHFNGDSCSGLNRAKLNSHGDKAKAAFGDTNAKLTMGEASECDLDNIFQETKATFGADDIGNFSIGDMKADYEKMLTSTRAKAIEAMLAGGDGDAPKRKTAKEMGVTGEKALELVRKPMGPFNWALFTPDPANLELWDAGSLSVAEMQTLLPDDQVLCGLVRMGFGTGKFRRTKWVSIWWVGSKVSAVKKGQMLGSGKDQVIRKINSGGITLEGATVDDVSVDEVIDKVKRSAIIDGDDVDGIGGARDAGADPFSMDAYYAALEEEIKGNAAFFGEKVDGDDGRSFGLQSTVKEVRAADGKQNWCLVEAVAV